MLPRHARGVLSRLRCNEHSLLLGSYLSRIGRIILSAAPVDTSHVILHCPATDSLRRRSLFCLFTTSGPDPGELPGFWGSMVSRYAPIPRKGSGKQQQILSRQDRKRRGIKEVCRQG